MSARVRLLRRAAAIALVTAAVLLAAACGGGGGGEGDGAAESTDNGTIALLEGIPQRGVELGRDDAPVTLVEFADIQCPFCAEWALDTFPDLVREYVKPGKVKLVFRGLAFLGEDSVEGLRAVIAAGQQNKLWQYLELLFAEQGAENSDWVTEELIRGVAEQVPGLDVDKLMAGRDAEVVTAAIAQAEQQARRANVQGTPTFFIGRGDSLRQLAIQSLDADAFRPALDEELAAS
jgi:protein-disulfide isomerase